MKKILGMLVIVSFLVVLLGTSVFAISYDLAPTDAKEGSIISMLKFNVSNSSSIGNTLQNVTVDLLGTATAGNITNVTLSDGTNVYYVSNPSAFPLNVTVDAAISAEVNFTLNFTISSSATDAATVQANVTDIYAEVNVTYDTLPYTSSATTVDSSPPTVSFVSPTPDDGVNLSTSTVTFNATSADTVTAITSCLLELDGAANYTMTIDGSGTSVSCNYTNSSMTEETHTYKIYSDDSYNHWGVSATQTVVVDRTAPAVIQTTPVPGYNASGSVIINTSITDAVSGTQYVYYWIENASGANSTAWTAMTNTGGNINDGNWSATLDTTTIPDGVYNITINATDFTGSNTNVIKTILVIDNTPPTVTAIYPPSSTILYFNNSFEFNASVIDSTSGVPLSGYVYYAVTNSSGDNVTAWAPMTNESTDIHSNNYDISSVTLPSPNDVYYLTVNATDYAGNPNLVNVTQFGYDTAAPQISHITSTDALTGGSTVQFNVTVTDLNISTVNITIRHLLSNTTWLLASLTGVNTTGNLTELSFQPNYSGSYQLEVIAVDHVQPTPYSTFVTNSTFFTVYNGRPVWSNVSGAVSLVNEAFSQFKNHYDMPVPFYAGNPGDKEFKTSITNFEVMPMFTDKPFFAGPTDMQDLAYNYSFTINTSNMVNNSNVTLNFSAPGALPAYIQNITVPTPQGNQTMTMIAPAMSDPTSPNASFVDKYMIYLNGVLYDTSNSTSVEGHITFDSNGNPVSFNLTLIGLLNTTNYNVSIPMAVTPPIRLNSQNITGFDPVNPPELGSSIATQYVVNLTATNQYYIANNVSVLFMFPVNVTIDSTTHNISSNVGVYYWNGSSFVIAPTTNSSSCITVNDSMFNKNITVCIAEYRYQISNTSDLTSWKVGTNKTVKANATLSFPVLEEVHPIGGEGNNQYKAAVTMGTDAGLYIPSNKVPNIGSATSVKVYVNGKLLPSTDYALGSVKINGTALSAGANNIKVVYSIPITSSPGFSGPGVSTPKEVSQMFVFSALEAGSNVSMQISKEEMHVQEITLTVKNPAKDVKITIQKESEKPAEVTKDITGKNIYEYFKISKQNLKNADIESAVFKFKVSKQWFSDNNLDPETTGLDRFNEETQEWEHYDATMLSSDGDYYYFEATVPGFSVFAITAVTPAAQPTTPPEQPQQPTTPPAQQPQQPGEKVAPAQPISMNIAIGLIALIVFVFAVALFLKKRK